MAGSALLLDSSPPLSVPVVLRLIMPLGLRVLPWTPLDRRLLQLLFWDRLLSDKGMGVPFRALPPKTVGWGAGLLVGQPPSSICVPWRF